MSRKKSGGIDSSVSGVAFGKRLRELRLSKSVPVQQIANAIGCQRNFVTQIESGQRVPGFDTLIRLMVVLNANPGELFCDYLPEQSTQIIASKLTEKLEALPQEARDRIEAHINYELSVQAKTSVSIVPKANDDNP